MRNVRIILFLGIFPDSGSRILRFLARIKYTDEYRIIADLLQYFVQYAIFSEATYGTDERWRFLLAINFHTNKYSIFTCTIRSNS